jgi:hypothetical protein
LLSWIDFEKQNYSDTFSEVADRIAELEGKLPQKVKKRRRLNPDDPNDETMEEYHELVFPDDNAQSGGVSKLLAKIRQMKENDIN